MVRSGDGLRDAQAEAAALDGTAMGSIATKEALENAGPQFEGQDRAGIGDAEDGLLLVLTEVQPNAAVFVVMLHGIVPQDEQQLAQPHAVSHHLRRLTCFERDGNILRG